MTTALAQPPLRVGSALHPMYAAYDAYLGHQKQCAHCRTSLFVCPAGAELWEAFKAVLPTSS